MTFDLTGRRALVTGGGVGIGKAVALELARAGADVALTFHSHDGQDVAAEIEALGREAVALQLDATDSAQVTDVVAEAQDALGGPINILVNNAGGLIGRVPIAEMSDEHWHQVFAVNMDATFFVTRAVLAAMPDGGRIITIGSQAAQNGGGGGTAAYAASKAAIVGFTRGLSKELGARKITVNDIAPGFISETPFHETFSTAEAREAAIDSAPLGRVGTPEDVAAAVRFLASDEAGYQSGTVMNINGATWFTG